MGSHAECDHPATKAARARCRKQAEADGRKGRYENRGGGSRRVKVNKDRKGERFEPSDVVARAKVGKNGQAAMGLAQVILAKPDDYHPDDVARARQYLYGH